MIPRSQIQRILVVKLSSIGDVVMATPVAKALRNEFPNAYIAWVVEERSKDAVLGNPYLDEVIVWKRVRGSGGVLSCLRDLRPLGRSLRARRFDIAIDLQGLLRSAAVALLSGARYRLGGTKARECATLFYNIRDSECEKVSGCEHYLAILEAIGIQTRDVEMLVPLSDADREFAAKYVSERMEEYKPENGVAILCPATTWPQKHWTEAGWAELADRLIEEYRMLPIFLGSKADIPLRDRIFKLMRNRTADIVGKTTLKESAAVLSLGNVTFAVDTGLMHISMAFRRPTVAVFGPTPWAQFMRDGLLIPVQKQPECGPCMRRPTCDGYPCMSGISASDVLSAAADWLPKRIARG